MFLISVILSPLKEGFKEKFAFETFRLIVRILGFLYNFVNVMKWLVVTFNDKSPSIQIMMAFDWGIIDFTIRQRFTCKAY